MSLLRYTEQQEQFVTDGEYSPDYGILQCSHRYTRRHPLKVDADIFRQLQEADWARIGKKLLAHAAGRARRYYWRDGTDVQLAVGQTLEDIVQETIRRTISGERRWDPARGDLETWLMDQVNSLMDHLSKSAARQQEVSRLDRFVGDSMGEPNDGGELRLPLPAALRTASAEDHALRNEQVDEDFNLVIDAADGDTELDALLGLMLDGYEKPAEIAEAMGLPVRQVYTLVRKIRRRLDRKQGAYEAP